MSEPARGRAALGARESAWRRALLDATAQGLSDLALAGSAEVTFVAHEDREKAERFLDDLEDIAHGARFVTARLALHEAGGFDALDAVVRGIAEALTLGGGKGHGRKKTGLVPLLEAFVHEHGKRALEVFDENLEPLATGGDLISLARAFIETARQKSREVVQLEAWLNGVELARAEADAVAIAALSERTAKRSLGELTRLVRALGHPGTLLLFTDADKLAKLPPVRRENGYTVLRELVDNADGGRGLLATRVVVTGGRDFFHGVRSMAALKPLATRVVIPEGAAVLPPPHRPLLFLNPPDAWGGEESPHVEPVAIGERRTAATRAVIRASQGLPPVEAILSMSVGHEHIDATIDQLFEHSAMEGSVFALLTGAYGAGKTHLLLHLAARALVDQRPVLRLSLETLDADLGNPQRHLRRLLENAVLPLTGQPGPLDCLAAWVRSPQKLETLLDTLRTIRDEKGDAAHAADRALRNAARTTAGGAAIESFLSAQDLEGKPGGAGYRHDAYTRLLLWFELTERIEHCAGPVLLIDEAENLYKGGTSRAERRTALRSLAFYCGGTLPRACVVLAITPEMLKELRAESKELLDEIGEQRTVLAWEDASMLRRRLQRAKPEEVPALTTAHRAILAARIQATHASVRGKVKDPEWEGFVSTLSDPDLLPRDIVRKTVDRLEGLWWARRLADG